MPRPVKRRLRWEGVQMATHVETSLGYGFDILATRTFRLLGEMRRAGLFTPGFDLYRERWSKVRRRKVSP